MPREATDTINFIVQAEFTDDTSSEIESALKCSPSNLLEVSNRYGYLFFSLGSKLYVVAVKKSEEKFDGGESNFSPEFSFTIEFPADVTAVALSASESYLAVAHFDKLSILSVPNLLILVWFPPALFMPFCLCYFADAVECRGMVLILFLIYRRNRKQDH